MRAPHKRGTWSGRGLWAIGEGLEILLGQVIMKEKALIISLCLLGILGVCYGMVNRNHPVFIAGLVAVVAAYLMIRKKLKAHIREKYPSRKS